MKVTRVPGYQPQTTTTTYGVGGVRKGILLCGEPWHGLEHDGEHRKGWYPLCMAEWVWGGAPTATYNTNPNARKARIATERQARSTDVPEAENTQVLVFLSHSDGRNERRNLYMNTS